MTHRTLRQFTHATANVINGLQDRITINGYTLPGCPNLIAHAKVRGRYCPPSLEWTVSHVSSGLAVCCPPDKASALMTLKELAATGVDWTLSETELLEKHGHEGITDIIDAAEENVRNPIRQKMLFAA